MEGGNCEGGEGWRGEAVVCVRGWVGRGEGRVGSWEVQREWSAQA